MAFFYYLFLSWDLGRELDVEKYHGHRSQGRREGGGKLNSVIRARSSIPSAQRLRWGRFSYHVTTHYHILYIAKIKFITIARTVQSNGCEYVVSGFVKVGEGRI